MTSHPERYIWPCCLPLMLSVAAPRAADWLRTACHLPSGYGAEGDQRRAGRMPASLRAAVKERSEGAERFRVKASVEDGIHVYELHAFKDGEWSVSRITSGGNVIEPNVWQPEPGDTVEVGG